MKRLLFIFIVYSLVQCHTANPVTPEEPSAAFSVQGGDCDVPCEVSFLNNSQHADSYSWDFGDGQTAIDANPKHMYQQSGSFSVTLTITGPGGTKTVTQPVTIRMSAPTSVWDRTIGANGNEGLPLLVATPDGGFLLGGYSDSSLSGDKSEPTRGKVDYWIVKVDANGTKQWDKTFGGNDYDYLRSLITTPDGGFLLGGESSSDRSGDKSEPSTPSEYLNTDYWVVKINASGVKQWDKTIGGSRSDFLTSMTTTADGGFMVAGHSYSSMSGDKSEPSRGKVDYWVVKIDANGTKQWDKTFGGSGEDDLHSLIATSDGGFLLGGYSDSDLSGDKSEAPKVNSIPGLGDYWVVKMTANGTKQWDKTLGGAGPDLLRSMIATTDGGFLVGGESRSDQSGNKSASAKGETDYWVVKIDGRGTQLWDKAFGGSRTNSLQCMIPLANGSFLLGGYSNSGQSGDKSEPARGNYDYWLVNINDKGIRQWDKTIGGSSDDEMNAMVASADKTVMLVGDSSSGKSGEKSEPSKGGTDYWLIKVKQ